MADIYRIADLDGVRDGNGTADGNCVSDIYGVADLDGVADGYRLRGKANRIRPNADIDRVRDIYCVTDINGVRNVNRIPDINRVSDVDWIAYIDRIANVDSVPDIHAISDGYRTADGSGRAYRHRFADRRGLCYLYGLPDWRRIKGRIGTATCGRRGNHAWVYERREKARDHERGEKHVCAEEIHTDYSVPTKVAVRIKRALFPVSVSQVTSVSFFPSVGESGMLVPSLVLAFTTESTE